MQGLKIKPAAKNLQSHFKYGEDAQTMSLKYGGKHFSNCQLHTLCFGATTLLAVMTISVCIFIYVKHYKVKQG